MKSESNSTTNCPFCNRQPWFSSEYWNVFLDQYPVSPGHTLVVPKRHIASVFDLNDAERGELLNVIEAVKLEWDDRLHPDGYNIGVNVGEAAGQSVMHAHIHVIPRYVGDVENPRGGVRGVIPNKQNY